MLYKRLDLDHLVDALGCLTTYELPLIQYRPRFHRLDFYPFTTLPKRCDG